MRWITFFIVLLVAPAVFAGDGKVLKVLPLYLDSKGRDSLLPSLYERDAYQALLRAHRDQRKALRFAVQWKGQDLDWSKTRMVVEARGVQENTIVSRTAESPVHKSGHFHHWVNVDFTGKDFETMGELASWRVTFWEGNQKIGEQKSFLW
jgi:hypothetical protein